MMSYYGNDPMSTYGMGSDDVGSVLNSGGPPGRGVGGGGFGMARAGGAMGTMGPMGSMYGGGMGGMGGMRNGTLPFGGMGPYANVGGMGGGMGMGGMGGEEMIPFGDPRLQGTPIWMTRNAGPGMGRRQVEEAAKQLGTWGRTGRNRPLERPYHTTGHFGPTHHPSDYDPHIHGRVGTWRQRRTYSCCM
eukprot:gnl/TRDRNA2_/TRDRNA2_183557_c0_seq1.p1 gnl/TRDRNA2_/TRDRNA2_183557_c0~~gnl/TRDRNA2_/TRDRNA2_183557_c0_seq1.p1  ORF type:complete len:189 (+),score=22.70 gnl/TRDRNA2_/TRDRNA2_183557_c0_seq1:56-622(+)